MIRTMPTLYRLHIGAGMVSIAIHVVELGVMNTHPTLLASWVGIGVQIAGFLLTALLFGGAIYVFTKEGMKTAVAVSAVGHGVLIAAASFSYLHLKGWEWVQPTAMLCIFAGLVPYLLACFSDVEQRYAPGGMAGGEWQAWREDMCNVANENDQEVRAALATMEAQVRHLADQVAALSDTYTTRIGQATDMLTTQADAHRAELEALVSEAVERRIKADQKARERERERKSNGK